MTHTLQGYVYYGTGNIPYIHYVVYDHFLRMVFSY